MLQEVCPLLEDNLLGNKDSSIPCNTNQDSIIIRPLSWGVQEDVAALASEYFEDGGRGPLTHIICSDLVLYDILLSFICTHAPHRFTFLNYWLHFFAPYFI